MNNWKRLFYYLLINVFVSACTVMVVLTLWDRFREPVSPVAMESSQAGTPVAAQATGTTPAATIPTGVLPVASATPFPTTGPLRDIVEYQVKQNDTLGEIAKQYDVSIEELMEVNSLSDPNSLSVGIIIYIPVTPQPTPTVDATATYTPSPEDMATPNGPKQEARVVINSVIGAGDLTTERVFLVRTGDGPLSLAGWQMRDEDGNVFMFPQLELYEGGAVNVWTTTGAPTVVDLYWGLQSPVWRSGEEVTLLADDGKVHATYMVP